MKQRALWKDSQDWQIFGENDKRKVKIKVNKIEVERRNIAYTEEIQITNRHVYYISENGKSERNWWISRYLCPTKTKSNLNK